MRIRAFHIHGFGVFADVTVDSLSPGINLFYGDNESGKSTLLAFIRSVFFGFPDGRSRENTYPPLSGQKHGGHITLVDRGENRIHIERFAASRKPKILVSAGNNRQEDTSLLPAVLGAENRNLFKNIFAFSLTELQNFESLSRDSIREALYSASAGIDPQALIRLKSLLERKTEDIFKPGGRNPRINKILRRLTAIQNEKKNLNNTVDEYDRIRLRLRELDQQITRDEEQRMNLAAETGRLERWIGIWPEYVNLTQAEAKLRGLEKIDRFPDRGLFQFESIKEKIEEIEREQREKEEQIHQIESELQFLGPENEILQCRAELNALKRDQGRLEEVLLSLTSNIGELTDGENRLKNALVNLGRAWTEEDILHFDLSLAGREEARRLRDRLQQTRKDRERYMEILQDLCSKRDELWERLQTIPTPATEDIGLLKGRKEGFRELKNRSFREHDLSRELNYLEERLADLAEEKKLLDEVKISRMGPWFGWAAAVLFLLAIPLAIYFLLPLNQKGIVAVPAVLALLLILMRFVKQRLDRETERQEEDLRQRMERVTVRMEGLEEKQDILWSEKEAVQGETETLMTFLSLEEAPSFEELEKRVEDVESEIEHLRNFRSLKDEIGDLEKRIREAEERREEAEKRHGEAVKNWKVWLEKRFLDPALSPEGALETLSLIGSCREQVERICALRAKRSSLIETQSKVWGTVNRVRSFLSREPVPEEDLQIAVHDLIQEFEKAEMDRQQRDILIKDRKNGADAVQRLVERKKSLEGDLAELMEKAGVDEEEAFMRHGRIYEKRRILFTEIERCKDSLFRLTRGLEDPERVMESMAAMNLEDLEGRKTMVDRDLKTLGDRLERHKAEKAKSEERSEWLAKDERSGELRYEEQILKEELAAAAEEWCVNRLALALMRMARTRFERDRQPDVIREAADIFRQMTLGRYRSLTAPIGETNIEILDKDHTSKGINQLSRGTAEQLYLALRFGFIREFSKHSPVLPVIMDDILVNFDPSRAEAAIRGMIELSHSHQILFFTCHPETGELFKKAGVSDRFFQISKGLIQPI